MYKAFLIHKDNITRSEPLAQQMKIKIDALKIISKILKNTILPSQGFLLYFQHRSNSNSTLKNFVHKARRCFRTEESCHLSDRLLLAQHMATLFQSNTCPLSPLHSH